MSDRFNPDIPRTTLKDIQPIKNWWTELSEDDKRLMLSQERGGGPDKKKVDTKKIALASEWEWVLQNKDFGESNFQKVERRHYSPGIEVGVFDSIGQLDVTVKNGEMDMFHVVKYGEDKKQVQEAQFNPHEYGYCFISKDQQQELKVNYFGDSKLGNYIGNLGDIAYVTISIDRDKGDNANFKTSYSIEREDFEQVRVGEKKSNDGYELIYDPEQKKFVVRREFSDLEDGEKHTDSVVAEFPDHFDEKAWMDQLFPERKYEGFYSPDLGEDNSWLLADILNKAGIKFSPQASEKRLKELSDVFQEIRQPNEVDEGI